MKKIISFVFAMAVVFLIIAAIFWMLDKRRSYNMRAINNDPAYTEGIIIDISTYKSAYVEVEYFVDGKRFTHKQGFPDFDESKLEEGQKLKVKYSKSDPSIAIIELY